MKKALIINAHQEYPFAKGELNRTVADKIGNFLSTKGYEIRTTTMKDNWDVEEEVSGKDQSYGTSKTNLFDSMNYQDF